MSDWPGLAAFFLHGFFLAFFLVLRVILFVHLHELIHALVDSLFLFLNLAIHYFFFPFLDFPASLIAIAIDCFSGLPECLSSDMFSEMTSLLLPFLSGMM